MAEGLSEVGRCLGKPVRVLEEIDDGINRFTMGHNFFTASIVQKLLVKDRPIEYSNVYHKLYLVKEYGFAYFIGRGDFQKL